MFELGRLRSELERMVAALEPRLLTTRQAADVLAEFVAIERLAGAARTLLAARAADAAWKPAGDRSAAHWLARVTGTSVGQAITVLETGARVEHLPATEQALRAGTLSTIQVAEVAAASRVAPDAEAELLRVAHTEPIAALKKRCRKVRAAALPDERARHEAIRVSRHLRHWIDPDGAFRMDLRTTTDAGAEVLAALAPHRDRIFNDARRAGRREGSDAYLADALIELARSGGGRGECGRRRVRWSTCASTMRLSRAAM